VRTGEIEAVAEALGEAVITVRPLAGGFSHETCLLTLAGGNRVVVRLGGADPAIEAAVMVRGGTRVPVPRLLRVVPAAGEEVRPAMVLEYVAGTPLSDVLTGGGDGMVGLGAEVGRVIADIGAVSFDRPGFFRDRDLGVWEIVPWSRLLPEFVANCMDAVPAERLDPGTWHAWAKLCAKHAPALAAVDGDARLVHADANPKNILVAREGSGWRVTAVLDWEFSFSGCPYADAGNMMRFSDEYPADFTAGFRAGFSGNLPAGLSGGEDWDYLGRIFDMFALSDLVTRPTGHAVADQAATQIRRWVAAGVPGTPRG
jgi:aminoglycoside phosphotransferase (APT) family kinase protein